MVICQLVLVFNWCWCSIGAGVQLVLVFKEMDGEEDPRSWYDAA